MCVCQSLCVCVCVRVSFNYSARRILANTMSSYHVYISCLYIMSTYHVYISCLYTMSIYHVYISCLYTMSIYHVPCLHTMSIYHVSCLYTMSIYHVYTSRNSQSSTLPVKCTICVCQSLFHLNIRVTSSQTPQTPPLYIQKQPEKLYPSLQVHHVCVSESFSTTKT